MPYTQQTNLQTFFDKKEHLKTYNNLLQTLTTEQKQLFGIISNAHGFFEPLKPLETNETNNKGVKRKIQFVDLTKQEDLQNKTLQTNAKKIKKEKKQGNTIQNSIYQLIPKIVLNCSEKIWEQVYKDKNCLFLEYLLCNQQSYLYQYFCKYNDKNKTLAVQEKINNIAKTIYSLFARNKTDVESFLERNRKIIDINRKKLINLKILPSNRQILSLQNLFLLVPDNINYYDLIHMPIKIISYNNYFHTIKRIYSYKQKNITRRRDRIRPDNTHLRKLDDSLAESVILSEEKFDYDSNYLYLFMPKSIAFRKRSDIYTKSLYKNKLHIKYYSAHEFTDVDMYVGTDVTQNLRVYKFIIKKINQISEHVTADRDVSISDQLVSIPFDKEYYIALNTLDQNNSLPAILTFRCFQRILDTKNKISRDK